MFFVYVAVTALFIRLMARHSDEKISIHNYFIALMIVTTVECAVTAIEYDIYNSTGKRNLKLTALVIFLSSLRETIARLICLLLALGYGIIMKVLNRYASNICLISFLYFIAVAVNYSAFYINQHK